VVWALTGLWHGASWNFVFWGLYYGVLLILEKLILADVLRKMPAVFRHLYTLFAVLIGWILFYHESMTDVLAHIGALFGIGANGLHNAQVIYCLKRYAGILAAAVLACFPWGKLMEVRTKRGGRHLAPRASSGPSGFGLFMHSAVSTVLFAISMCFIVGQSYNPFLYFRF
ncbi:MAG: MBOAT family protein, partial [Eubacteriales bacterium]|nr:MBOAT family protein [Eubacteriales bacterium]